MSVKLSRVFFDTNVFVYQFDQRDQAKRTRAIEVVQEAIRTGQAVISTQVVQEFMNVALHKFAIKLTQPELDQVLGGVLGPLCQHSPSLEFYQRALNRFAGDSLSFYDTLIVQAALDLDCRVLYSEDLQHGRQFGELRVINPFTAR